MFQAPPLRSCLQVGPSPQLLPVLLQLNRSKTLVTGAIMFDTSVFYTLQTTTPSSHVVHSIHAGWL